LREGMPVEKIREIEKLKNLKHSSLEGVGVNLACFGGVIPTREKMEKLLDIKNTVEKILDKKIKIISGGNSSSLPLLIENNMPEGVNMLRIGETIMLGTNVIDRSAFPETFQDTFVFEAEIIELYDKPSVPDGKIGQDAFGNVPMFEDKGIMKRAIIACGRQDIDPEGLIPLGNYEVLGASSDHVIVDVTNYKYDLRIGDTLKFIPNYSALLRAYTSSYVKKYYYES
jgi:predicted amino acid racemase